MRIIIVTGSRADEGLLAWPIKTLEADPYFTGQILSVHGAKFAEAFDIAARAFEAERPDMILVLGDRFEILAVTIAAHLLRIPIAHIGGGDVTEGSYDDGMRDCISRMGAIHFVTSENAMVRLTVCGYRNVHLVGNPGVDFIRHAEWKGPRPIAEPYVVVSYQTETIDGTQEWNKVLEVIGSRKAIVMAPNLDRGNAELHLNMILDARSWPNLQMQATLSHAEFLNLLAHCDEFIGNSSAMLYEAPELGVPCRMIGKRQQGRVAPWGDGKASERIRDILKAWKP